MRTGGRGAAAPPFPVDQGPRVALSSPVDHRWSPPNRRHLPRA